MKKKILAIFLLSCFLLGNTTAYALTYTVASSDKQSKTVYGYNYTFCSEVYAYDDGCAVARTDVSANKQVPIGYIGVNARLYNSVGTLLKSSEMTYNDSALVGWSYPSGSYYGKGTYYSQAQVAFYNGNGYNTYTDNKSPNVQVRSIYAPMKNDNGEIYGSKYFLNAMGIEPDLIQAEGQNGVLGYVRAEDLDHYEPSSPEEAITYQQSFPIKREILLYSQDGMTAIDTFLITNSSDGIFD